MISPHFFWNQVHQITLEQEQSSSFHWWLLAEFLLPLLEREKTTEDHQLPSDRSG